MAGKGSAPRKVDLKKWALNWGIIDWKRKSKLDKEGKSDKINTKKH